MPSEAPPKLLPRTSNPAADNIRAIVALEREALQSASRGERISGAISRAVGTMTFVVIQMVLMVAWMGWNLWTPSPWQFDPYPFGLLTFIVSLEGVLIATFVLVAQNQMSVHSTQRDHLNLQVDLLAEQEMTVMLKLLRRICERLEISLDRETERAEQLAEETNVYDLMQTINEEMPQGERKD